MQVRIFFGYLAKLETLSSRLEMMAVLVDVFSQLEIDEVRPACYLLQGQLAPSYQNSEFQLSTKMILRALAQLSQTRLSDTDKTKPVTDLFGEVRPSDVALVEVAQLYKKLGDIGQVAEQVRGKIEAYLEKADQIDLEAEGESKSEINKFSVFDLHQHLLIIAQELGSGSQERKVELLVELLLANDALSAKFICRMIMGRLRLGFSTMTMLDALSWLVAGDKSLTGRFEEAYQKRADFGELAELIVANHRTNKSIDRVLTQFSVRAGVPVVPALCQRLNSAREIIDKLQTVIAEPKYDGLRVQIHFWRSGSIDNEGIDSSEISNQVHNKSIGADSNGMLIPTMSGQHDGVGVQYGDAPYSVDEAIKVRVFTRNLEDASHMFPELIGIVQSLNCQSCVLDAEAIGFDLETGKLKAFQETITRKRKHGITQASADVPLKFFVFDILEENGRPLIDLPLSDRKQILLQLLTIPKPNSTSPLVATEFITTTDAQELQDYHHHQLSLGLEGVVAKAADSQYRPGRKGWRWVKIKEAEGTRGKLNDTLDLVVMGYYLGRGKRTKFGLGALLAGVIDDQLSEPRVLSISKIGTGLSEEQLKEIKNLLDTNIVDSCPTEYQTVDKTLEPDVWVSPNLILEIAADEITDSPVHGAGVALRFPRLISIRYDKTWQQGTSIAELKQIALS